MEYNKNRFQKTNDKKILHKVKKQWVVLSVALLAALGGGATVATTHASANANGANGQNNDQETTIKNRINQNLKMAQSQNANNASQGQTKQVNVNSLSSDQITKQANLLHNQMLLGATQGTNPKTANGRQAARKNARVNRVNANTSAAASVANRKPAANANHSRMFGAAAPSANFGAMRKPEMRLGAIHYNIGDEQAKSFINPKDVKKAFVDHVRANSGTASQIYANSAYDNLLSMASADNVKSVANNGMNLGSDNPDTRANTWIGNFNKAKQYLDSLGANNRGGKLGSLVNDVDSMANTLYSSSVNSNVSVNTTTSITTSDVKNAFNSTEVNSLTQSKVDSVVSFMTGGSYHAGNDPLTVSSASVDSVSGTPIKVTGTANVNTTISNLINNGTNVTANVSGNLNGLQITVSADAIINKNNPDASNIAKEIGAYLSKTITPGSPFTVTHTIKLPDSSVSKTINGYHIGSFTNHHFTAYDIASILDGQNPNNKAKHTKIDPLLHDVLATKENPNELSKAGQEVRDAINAVNDPKMAGQYQQILNDAKSLSTHASDNDKGGNEPTEISALDDIHTQFNGSGAGRQYVSGLADSLKAKGNQASSFATELGDLANNWANSMFNGSSEIASASASANVYSNDVNNDTSNSAVKADSSASAALVNAVNVENSASGKIASASSAYSSNADLNSTVSADASNAAVSASSASTSASTVVSQAESSAIASASSAVNSELNSVKTASTSASASNTGDNNTDLSKSLNNDIASLTSASNSIRTSANSASAASESADATNDSNSAVSASTDANNANNAISSINASASSNSNAISNDISSANSAVNQAAQSANSANVKHDPNVSGNAQNDLNAIKNDKHSMKSYVANSNSANSSADKSTLSDINNKLRDLSGLVSQANSSKVASDSKAANNDSNVAKNAASSQNVKADGSIASQFNTDKSIINSASSVISASNSGADVAPDDNASGEASMAMSNMNSLVNDANASATEKSNLALSMANTPVNYTVPIHIVYENANGNEQKKYDQSDDQYVSNSDIEYVMINGKPGHNASVVGYTGSATNGVRSYDNQSNVGQNAELFNNDSSDTRHALGSDSNYSLVSVSDSGAKITNNALTPKLNASDGSWTWSDTDNNNRNQSTPTFIFKANPNSGEDINVQYINQNGYKVNAVASASNYNGAAELTPNSAKANQRSLGSADQKSAQYSGDINYLGSNSYGDTINVIAGLSSAAKGIPYTSDGNGSIFSTTYSYGFARNSGHSDTNPSYSDYTFNSNEQTVTLPIHGKDIPSNYSGVHMNIAVRDHKGSFTSSVANSIVSISEIAGKDNVSAVHYGDLLKVDPASFAPSGTDVASSDYNVDPFNTSSDNTGQNVPEIYISEDGPRWISIDNRQDAIPQTIHDVTSNTYHHNAYQSTDAEGNVINHSASDVKYTTARGAANEPFNDNTNTSDTITFNYNHGQHEGTVMPIHVTYRDQNGNVVQEGMINPSASDYGDMINIPSGANITKSGSANANSMFESGATLPSGYSIDYNKDGTNADHYIVNSDYNATNYDNYQIGTKNKTTTSDFKADKGGNNFTKDSNGKNTNTYAGNDMTIYVRGQYHTTTGDQLQANVHFENSDGQSVANNADGKIQLYVNGYNGNSEIISPSDFEPQAYDKIGPKDDNDKVNGQYVDNYQVTPSDTRYKVTFNGNDTITTQKVNNDGQSLSDAVTSSKNDGINFTYRVPTNKVTQHTVHVHYYYSDMSDVPDGQTPDSYKHVIPLSGTDITEMVPSDKFNLNPYIANPPKGYQFVTVMNDDNTTKALKDNSSSDINKLKPNTRAQGNYNNLVQLSSDSTDDIDIKLVPTARGITFHYYDQNGNPVKPDSDNEMTNVKVFTGYQNGKPTFNKTTSEVSGQDFTNGGYSDGEVNADNTHTEFGNTPTQGLISGHDSRYGMIFNVSDIPVPSGYHISYSNPQGQRRYYRFTRDHQDVDVMVVGNQDDVSNDPKNPSAPKVTTGDKDSNSKPIYVNSKTGQHTTIKPSDMTNWTKTTTQGHQDADTIWVTIHEMDPLKHQIRSYMVPSYISGDTGDQFHIYASDFTPEAHKDESGNTEYYFTPYGADNIHDTGATPKAGTKNSDNYIMAEGNINPDGTIHAYSDTLDGTTLNTPNHVDFYYYITPATGMKPINVTYMDGSKAVGYKQITPNHDNYPGETVSDTINNTTTGHNPLDIHQINGDTKTGLPSGYVQVQPSDTYPTSFDINHDQDIIIPVMRNHQPTRQNNTYVIINHFYSGVDGGMSSLVADSSSTVTMSSEYSGQQNFVSGSASDTYSNSNYIAGSENSTADVINTSDGATPGVVNFNYYSNAPSMNSSQTGPQGSNTSTAQPIYVQYFAGGSPISLSSNASVPSNAGYYFLGNDNKLTGLFGTDFSNVTREVSVPAGYHLDPSDQQLNYSIKKQAYQVDLHVSRTQGKDAEFPLNIIIKDANGKEFDHYTDNVYVENNTTQTINSSDYNPNQTYLTPMKSEDTEDNTATNVQNGSFSVHNQDGTLNHHTGTLVYQMTGNAAKDTLAPINVHYIDVDTGEPVDADNSNNTSDGHKINTINGNYINQDFSDITKENGTGNSTVPSSQGYQLVKGQNLNQQIARNPKNVDVLVKKTNDTGTLTVNVVEVDKNNGTYTYLPKVVSDMQINSDKSLDPHNFIPMDTYTTTKKINTLTGNSDYGPNSTAYYVDPIDHSKTIMPEDGKNQSVTYFYDKGHQHNYSGSIILRYFDDHTGKQVGTTDLINGKGTTSKGQKFNRYGQKIDVQNDQLTDGNNSDSIGENTPNGYTLDTASADNVDHTFTNDNQDVNLFVHGNPVHYPLTVRVHEENGNQPSDVFTHTYDNEPEVVGDPIVLNPHTYTPAGYQVEPNDDYSQTVNVKSDGLSPNVVDFYYNKDNNLFTKPYVVRYVNQNGKQVGYSDVVSNPDVINKSDIDLTKPSDGGEAVPNGYYLASDYYQNQPVHNYRFGNNHTITLKVTGKQVTVPMKIYMVEKSPDGRNSDDTHVYTTTEEISGKVGSSDHFLNADQYLTSLPNLKGANGQDQYSVDSSNTAKKVTIQVDSQGNPFLSIHEWNNGTQNYDSNAMTDNQAVFYYDPANEEKPAPIHVHYLDENTGQEITSGVIDPSNDTYNKGKWIDSIGTQISDVTNNNDGVTPGNSTSKNKGNRGVIVPVGYHKDNRLQPSEYNATFMSNPQNVYIPLQPDQYHDTLTVYSHIYNTQGKPVNTVTTKVPFDLPKNATKTYSPYDYIPKGYGDLFATTSDNDQTEQVQPNKQNYRIDWDYTASTNASAMQVGTINVHYVTNGNNNGQNIPIYTSNNNKTGYYQVDQESDHGLQNQPFDLTDYLNDIPSYYDTNTHKTDYYHLVTSGNNYGAVIGYNGVNGADNPIQPSQVTVNNPKGYQFEINGVHDIYGDPTYATKTKDGKYALNTQDIYVLVAPNSDKPNGFNGSSTPDNEGNNDTGNGNNFQLF